MRATDAKRKRRRRAPAWSQAHVRRLFWRAGFGATPDELERWAKAGRRATLKWVLDGEGDGKARLEGAESTVGGRKLDPVNQLGEAPLWWVDRMIRTTRPLEERMTLFWHDHFATRDQETPYMLAQNKLLRRHALGNFRTMLREVTVDPAMQLFLDLLDSTKTSPNENFARELMELFTIGKGYTENDIREAARALTGFKTKTSRQQISNGEPFEVYVDEKTHDAGEKSILGRKGDYDWQDVLTITLRHRRHAPFLIEKLWSYFIATPMPRDTRNRLVRRYRRNYEIKPIVRAILEHPHLYRNLDQPDMVKWPAVYVAGMLRTTGWRIDRKDWISIMDQMGQRLLRPPSVAGWEWGEAWMTTVAIRGRLIAARYVVEHGPPKLANGSAPKDLTPRAALALAKAATGKPQTTRATDATLRRLAADLNHKPDGAQRSLRQLLLGGPDNQLC